LLCGPELLLNQLRQFLSKNFWIFGWHIVKRAICFSLEEVRVGCAPRRWDRTSMSPLGRCENFRRDVDPKRKHVPMIGCDCFEIARIDQARIARIR
jgi:hypothetical protein